MNETKFKLHTDCDYPCIHLEVYINGEIISDTEIDMYSQLKYLDNSMIDEYNSLLNSNFIIKCDELKEYYSDSRTFRDKLRDLEMLQNRKRILDAALNERDNNV